jgi:hypothetical protein
VPITAPDGRVLGEFVPGLGYWVTPENMGCVKELLTNGRMIPADPSGAPLGTGGLHIKAIDSEVSGVLVVEPKE